MPSYVVTGASRGLGYAFIKHLVSDPSNTVIGLVRNKKATEERIAKDGLKGNLHIFEADIVDVEALKSAAAETAKLTGGSVDVLINNAAFVSEESNFATIQQAEEDLAAVIADFTKSFEINVNGIVKTITAFLPLIRKSSIKKVISLSTGMADMDFVVNFSIPVATPYAVTKAGMNMLTAKYHTAYGKSEGILFLGISPGLVSTAENKTYTEAELEGFKQMIAMFQDYAPNFQGPISPQQSVDMVLKVIDDASVEKNGGDYVSHYGNKQWL